MQTAKQKLKNAVSDYIKLFPEEYAAAIKGTEMLRSMTKDEFASIDGMFYGRALFEIPEKLDEMIVRTLNEEELKWFKEGGLNRKEGARWFANNFKQFAIAQKI